ncbi:2,3-bisphosphoglycerate-independent phosphoglycerate mutase [uncultured Selenomonas sp.]|uniref:2,3-bisphosphoglycerate-independent phosphoglycerate mutase n=1 Tax=uncultured Selenomonas sp. TaxID=159275 RepID=UPI0025862027|nr:2,3-bisphosphoglycerate-independent phosphoglycerate mutase [uncultured Selenomonas sp.]
MAKLKNAPVALIIMDGCGLGGKLDESNAVEKAKTPVLDGLLANYNSSHLQASGEFVGLPDGQMGNSEVGHTNIGAGRLVYQQLTRITRDIKNGDFFKNEALVSIMKDAKEKGGAVHLMGLVSPGGVHSHQGHLYALLEMAKQQGVSEVYVHAFLDGRDVPPQSAQPYLEELEAKCKEIGVGTIATVSGRYYAMDRDHRWDREQKAYEAIAHAEGVAADDPVAGLKASYASGVNDEFVVPFVVKGYCGMKNGDGAIFFNFRPDRARQLTHAFVDETFDGFERDESLKIPFATFSQYEDGMNAKVAFPPETIVKTLGEVIQDNGMTQLRIAETEKYAHVTFFFNGGVEEMSAVEVTDKVCEAIRSGKYDFIILNYANCDMVGHTGVFPAVVKAVETVDSCVGRFVAAIKEVGGEVCITADHGNADKMMDYVNNQPFTKHTTNAVPFIVVSDRVKSVKDGALSDIAPTLLTLAGVDIPKEMTGKNLVEL